MQQPSILTTLGHGSPFYSENCPNQRRRASYKRSWQCNDTMHAQGGSKSIMRTPSTKSKDIMCSIFL